MQHPPAGSCTLPVHAYTSMLTATSPALTILTNRKHSSKIKRGAIMAHTTILRRSTDAQQHTMKHVSRRAPRYDSAVKHAKWDQTAVPFAMTCCRTGTTTVDRPGLVGAGPSCCCTCCRAPEGCSGPTCDCLLSSTAVG
jgi:hypothetical protein